MFDGKGVTNGYIDVIKDMYDWVTTIQLLARETSEFLITLIPHQGLALSPHLFS